jgi:uncharacterized protein YraI
MKRFLISLLFLLLPAALPALAQDNTNLITLNDATPAIDVVITMPPDTTGTVSLAIAQAAITLIDSTNTVVFHAADARLHGVEINIAPNSGSHTLTVERLPGITEASVSVASLPELNINGSVEHVEGAVVTLNQEITLSLDTGIPGGTADVSIPDGTIGVVTATFPGSNAATQLIDTQGVVVAQSAGGHVDGINLVLDAGSYEFTVLGSGLTSTVVTGVRVVSAEDAEVAVLEAPASAENVAADTTGAACTAIVTHSSVNLRSGPGTGYSVLGYGYFNENYVVGGRNPENNWIVVGTDGGSAWMALPGVNLQGECDALTVFNIPLRDAEVAPIIITTPSHFGNDDDEHEDHEEGEHESGEHEEGDDD